MKSGGTIRVVGILSMDAPAHLQARPLLCLCFMEIALFLSCHAMLI
jgi:hypothetical protein